MLKIQGKQGFAMPKHRKFLFDAVDLMSFVSPKGRGKFLCLDHKNHLDVALAMPRLIFTTIHQKFITRKIHAVSVNRS